MALSAGQLALQNSKKDKQGYEVFVRNLLEDTKTEELYAFFEPAGKIIRAPRLNLGRGFAWITFDSMAAVAQAVSWSGSYLGSRIVYVHPANNVSGGDGHEKIHHPALCDETVEKMIAPNPGGVYVDGTFGRGGHTKAMLAAMSPTGKMHAFDMDPEAIRVGKELMAADPRFTIHYALFSTMGKALKKVGVAPGSVSGVLLDVGISSPQFDDVSRGFRPEADGALDLRFDTGKGVPASEFLTTVPRAELVRILSEYGEESGGGHAARRIADAICLARSRGQLPTTTKRFAELVAQAKGKETSGQVMHPAKMTFQALRIHLNDEFEEMRKGMRAAFKLVGEGGRVGLITWKFSERKIVDEVYGALEAVRADEPLLKWYQGQPGAPTLPEGPSMESEEVVRPSEKELKMNSRARVALLHVLHKRNLPRLSHLEKQAYALPGWAQVVAPVGSTEAAAAHEEPSGKRKGDAESKPKKKAKK
jgi:16S rRNA (cytosine1402-N4)-methyltransferase